MSDNTDDSPFLHLEPRRRRPRSTASHAAPWLAPGVCKSPAKTPNTPNRPPHAAFAEVARLEGETQPFRRDQRHRSYQRPAPPDIPPASVPTLTPCLELAAHVSADTFGVLRRHHRRLAETRQNPPPPPRRPAHRARTGPRTESPSLADGGHRRPRRYRQGLRPRSGRRRAPRMEHPRRAVALRPRVPSTRWAAQPGSPPWDCCHSRTPQSTPRRSAALRLRDAALAGSGALLHGQHIIDPAHRPQPARGAPSAPGPRAPSAATADALSTAFMILTPDEIAPVCAQNKAMSLPSPASNVGSRHEFAPLRPATRVAPPAPPTSDRAAFKHPPRRG